MSERDALLPQSPPSRSGRMDSGSVSIIATSYDAFESHPGGRRVRLPISRAHAINVIPDDDLTESTRETLATQREDDIGFRLRLGLIRRVDSRNALPPNHVVPNHYFVFVPFESEGEQSSLITVLAIWNTMLGTSILCMPWAIQQAGFFLGIGILCFMALCCWYTSALILKNCNVKECADFSTVCEAKLGKWGRFVAFLFSLIAFCGAMIVYYVLLSNFLFHVVDYIYQIATPSFEHHNHSHVQPHPYPDVVCKKFPSYFINGSMGAFEPDSFDWTAPLQNVTTPKSKLYGLLWQEYRTVPLWLLIIVFPLISLKSPTFFTKFNALGAVSILFLIGVIIVKCSVWGIHFDLSATDRHHFIPLAKPTFVVVCGISSLAFFIHNAAIAIMKNQKNQENKIRDLSLGYGLGLLTYLAVGIIFYIGYPLPKECLEDNFLNNIRSSDLMTTISRGFLLFQMITVFPLLTFIFRSQFMYGIFRDEYPSVLLVTIMNVVLMAVCVLFAMFLPSIGSIIRFVGAFCGMVYIFTLPSLVHMKSQKEQSKLTKTSIVLHSSLVVIGVAIFIGQLLTI